MKLRIVYIVAHAISAEWALRGQLEYMRKQGFDVTLIASPGPGLDALALQEGIDTKAIPIQREIDAVRDLIALWKLYHALRLLHPDIVNASTPKAGLLGMLAAWLSRVPVRIYTLRGLRLETATGLKRFVLHISERLASACANKVVCVGESLRHLYVKLGLASADKTVVYGAGSSNGVDVGRFRIDDSAREEACAIRKVLRIPACAPVIGFVGRLTRDKGIVELAQAFQDVLETIPGVRLVMVGDFEDGDSVPEDCVSKLRAHPQVAITGFVADPKPYYVLMDVLAFPTHREGFSNVALEAAAMEVPVVGFQVTGVVDAVQDGITGTLLHMGDVQCFASAIKTYLADSQLRRKHGIAGHQRALRDFHPHIIWESLYKLYMDLAEEKGILSLRTRKVKNKLYMGERK